MTSSLPETNHAAPTVELIKNSFDVDDTVFHGLMALGVLKEIIIKNSGAQHKRWFAFMRRTGRFADPPDFPAWSQDELLEYVRMILEISDAAHPLYPHARDGIAALSEFSEQHCLDYEHLINVGASINRPPFEIIRI